MNFLVLFMILCVWLNYMNIVEKVGVIVKGYKVKECFGMWGGCEFLMKF